MPIIDDKVVAMSFESDKFESGVSKTMSALDKLKNALKFPNSGKGLEDIQKSADRLDFGHISRSLEGIKSQLGAFRLTAIAVFSQVAAQAISAGGRILKGLTLQPLLAGYNEYSTNLNSIQTILANTEASGATLDDVNAALLDLNKYSDKTIYNFSQMARNIGTFTAAGVDLKTSTASIKGIANLAALSGSNAEQASTAMYQLSQAISAGRVGLQDWNSVVNAGMGGTVFQRALAQTAEAMGTIKKGAVDLRGPMKNVVIDGKSFRQSITAKPGEESWLTSKVLTTTLQQFTGDLSAAELKAQGFNDAQIKAIQQTARTATHAATEVKTLTQVLDVARETAGSGWAQTWQIVFGDFGEAKTLFTNVSNAINGFINANSEARNKVLKDWKALGGRTILINSIKTAFQNLGAIIAPIKDAFRDIFPATTGRDLLKLTKMFQGFAESLKPSDETVKNLRRTFRGLFALLDIGKQVVGGIFSVFQTLFHTVGAGQGGFLSFTANMGDFIVEIDNALKKGNALNNFFKRVGEILSIPVKMVGELAHALSELFTGLSAKLFTNQIDTMTASMTPFEKVVEALSSAWDAFASGVSNSHNILQPAFDAVIAFIQGIGPAIGKAASSMNFEAILQVVRTGLLAGLVVMLKSFLGKGSLLEQLGGAGGGFLGNLSQLFGSLTGSMKAMQRNIQADTLRKIAIAIALLTASVVALSFVDPERLKSALAGMATAFGTLLGGMAILDKIGSSGGFLKMPFIAASMIAFAAAIDILAIAVIALGKMDWDELKKGVGSVAFLLASISAASKPLSANSAGLVTASIGINAIAIAMNILAIAVRKLGEIDMITLGKGLGAVAVGLKILTKTMTLTKELAPKTMLASSIAIGILSVALYQLASSVEKFGKMNWKVIARGLIEIGAALTIIGLAMKTMPASTIASAAGLVLVSFALQGIAKALGKMGKMSVKEIAKSLVTLALSLSLLSSALYAMEGTLPGAAALGVAAVGLSVLIPALILLGKQSWTTILKSLAGLAAAMAVLGVSAALMAPAVPVMLGLGAAILLLGGGVALLGAGIFALASGISVLAVAGPTGIGILVAAFIELSKAIPEVLKNVVVGILEMVKAFADAAPEFVKALSKILEILADTVIKATPRIAEAFETVLTAALKIIRDKSPDLIKTGLELILNLLKGIRDNIGKIVDIAADVIINFINAISKRLKDIIIAGTGLIVAFIGGVASGIGNILKTAGTIVGKFIEGIANLLHDIAFMGLKVLTRFLTAIAENAKDAIVAAGKVIAAFVKGIGEAGILLTGAALQTITKFVTELSKQAVKAADAGAVAVINFLNGVADVIDKREPQIIHAGMRIGLALVTGLVKGLADPRNLIKAAVDEIADKVPNWLKKPWKIKSPSEVTAEIGRNMVQGLVVGFNDDVDLKRAVNLMGKSVVDGLNQTFENADFVALTGFIGKDLAKGFGQSTEDIKKSFNDVNTNMKATMKSLRDDFIEQNAKLNELKKADQPNLTDINNQAAVVRQIINQYAEVKSAHTAWVKSLSDEKSELLKVSKSYETVLTNLDKAKTKLEELKKQREDSIAGFTDKFNTLPDIVTQDAEGNAVDQLAVYMEALKHQADAVGAYKTTLDQLRQLGLDDKTYQKLLQEGTADQQFANQLLSGGRTAVQALNTLDLQLKTVSETLATNAGNNLYNAGINAAEGLVKGLEARKGLLRTTMENLAEEIVGALKKKLRIKSPSEVFAELGNFAMQGFAQGLANSSDLVSEALDNATSNALSAMQKTMSNISDTVAKEFDANPVITPVLDLSQVQAQAKDLAMLGDGSSITPTASTSQAALISSQSNANQTTDASAEPVGTTVKFEQNNYSPEALSAVEIYRQTRNQLAQLKAGLSLT